MKRTGDEVEFWWQIHIGPRVLVQAVGKVWPAEDWRPATVTELHCDFYTADGEAFDYTTIPVWQMKEIERIAADHLLERAGQAVAS